MQEKTDAELVALARAGNKDAFGQLIERYQPMAVRIALGAVLEEDFAHELAQEAVLQAYLSLDHLRDDTRFKSWLYGIVLNVCRSYLRARHVNMLSLEALIGGMQFMALRCSDVSLDPEQRAVDREIRRLVLDAVNALSLRDREAILLFYYEQLSQREIATILEISETAVKGRLHRARRRLKERLLSIDMDMKPVVLPGQRRSTMVKVTVADVLEPEQGDKQSGIVVLLDEVGRRVLAIWVGAWESMAIAMGLGRFPALRPMTFHFVTRILEATSSGLEEVRIEALKDGIFYAVVKLRNGDVVREIDARPSDAIALAVLMDRPIYVAEEILASVGITPPDGKTLQPGQARNSVLPRVENMLRAAQTPWVSGPNCGQRYQDLFTILFRD